MTQQQIVNEFRTFSKVQKTAIVRQLLEILEEDLKEKTEETTVDEKLAAIEKLHGIAAVEGKIPPTDNEIKESYIDYITEKYK